MTKIALPYRVKTSELKNELSSMGFNIYFYMTEGALKGIDTLLILRDGCLECFKTSKSEIDTDTYFQVIHVPDEPRDISGEIDSPFVLLSLSTPYRWGIGESEEPFEPKRGQSFMSIGLKKDSTEMSVFAMCLELSYRFGTKFYFYGSDDSYIVSVSPHCDIREYIFDEIVKHRREMESTYEVSIEVIKSYIPKYTPKKDDFE